MESLSHYYHRMVGLTADWSVTDVKQEVSEKMLRLTVEYVAQTLPFNPENPSREKNEELVKVRHSTLATGRAWSLKELFRQFWGQTDAVGGRDFFQSWYARAIRSRLKPVKKVARRRKDCLNRILTWFVDGDLPGTKCVRGSIQI
jgi:hypothetical protein